MPGLKKLALAEGFGLETHEVPLANHHQVRRGIRDGNRVFKSTQPEGNSIARRAAVQDVRQAVLKKRDDIAWA